MQNDIIPKDQPLINQLTLYWTRVMQHFHANDYHAFLPVKKFGWQILQTFQRQCNQDKSATIQ